MTDQRRNAMSDPISYRGSILPFARHESGKVSLAVPEMIMGPLNAMGYLSERGYTPGDADAVDAATTAVGGLMGIGYGRAAVGRAVGELGATAGELLKRPGVLRYIAEQKTAGATDKEIAASLNERFAPLLDDGAEVSRRSVQGVRVRDSARRGETELGAMGGKGTDIAPPRNFEASDIEAVAKSMGDLTVWTKTALPKASGDASTEYLKIVDRLNPPRRGEGAVEVRIPQDPAQHIGLTPKHGNPANFYDTGKHIARTSNRPVEPEYLANASGEPYSQFENIVDALKWRFSRSPDGQWLVAPDRAPNIRQPREPVKPIEPEGGPINHPDQLKLLSGGAPLNPGNAMGGWQTQTIEGDPGRFAQPALGDADANMLADTGRLTNEIAGAADQIGADMGRPVKYQDRVPESAQRLTDKEWSTFVDTLRQINAMGTYVPGDRESSNVVDERGIPWAELAARGFVLDYPNAMGRGQ